MNNVSAELVADIRACSRKLVRELGFLRPTLAGTDMSASAVHAILEIGTAGTMSGKQLAERLLLEKSTVSRLLTSLIRRGELTETPSATDARAKELRLSTKGKQTFVAISRTASDQVAAAISPLPSPDREKVRAGLAAYSSSLKALRCKPSDPSIRPRAELHTGYVPGLIADIVKLHIDYYSANYDFGATFETAVAAGLADFAHRIDNPVNRIWHVRRHGQIAGSIAIDGEDLGTGIGHLRWFFLTKGLRGSGTGNALLQAALGFCAEQDFAEVHLWTFKGLDAARRMYERHGFHLADEYVGDQWSKGLIEQKFVRKSP